VQLGRIRARRRYTVRARPTPAVSARPTRTARAWPAAMRAHSPRQHGAACARWAGLDRRSARVRKHAVALPGGARSAARCPASWRRLGTSARETAGRRLTGVEMAARRRRAMRWLRSGRRGSDSGGRDGGYRGGGAWSKAVGKRAGAARRRSATVQSAGHGRAQRGDGQRRCRVRGTVGSD
jgi:hypothetical protein